MIRTVCDTCGYDGTYYQPKSHYPKTREWGKPYHKCAGKFVTKDIPTEQEKMQKYVDWLTSRVRSKIQTDVGQEAYVSLLKLKELELVEITPSFSQEESKNQSDQKC